MGKMHGRKGWLIVIGVILLSALLTEIILVAFVFHNKDKGDSDSTEKPKTTAKPTPNPTDEPDAPNDEPVTVFRVKSQYYEDPTETYCNNIYTFDANGNRTERLWLNSEGGVEQRIEYRYDEKNRLIYSHWKNEYNMSEYTFEYAYDDRGRKTEETNRGRGYQFRTVYEYDDNDFLISQTEYSGEEEEMLYRYVFEYNDFGEVSQTGCYNAKGELYQVQKDEYDADGKLIEEREYKEPSHELTRKIKVVYNEEGLLSERFSYQENDTLDSREWYEYDERGNCTAEYYYVAPILSSLRSGKTLRTFDEKNREIREVSYYGDDETEERFSHDKRTEYDENGCVIKETYLKEDGTLEYISRFEYVSFTVPYSTLTDEEKEWYEREHGK